LVLTINGSSGLRTITLTDPLHIEFDVTETTSDSGDAGTVGVYNISNESRSILQLDAIGNSTGVLKVGYPDNTKVIYEADISQITDVVEGADLKTTFTLSVGFNEKQKPAISKSFPPQTKMSDIVKSVSSDMTTVNVDLSNLTSDKEFKRGVVVSENPYKFVEKLAKANNKKFIHVKDLMTISDDWTKSGNVYVCSSESGMIGIPEQVTSEEDTEDLGGVVPKPNAENQTTNEKMKPKQAELGYRVTMLLLADILPLDYIELSSRRLQIENMRLLVKSISHVGSNFGNDFYTIIEAYREQVKL
jgi:hypothetical protein